MWRLEAHIDAQNFNLILTHKIVHTFFLDGWASSSLRDFWTSLHLPNMRRDRVLEDIDPAEKVDCVLNVTISEKKTQGAIRMNIDMQPMNEGALHTKYHVPLLQEV